MTRPTVYVLGDSATLSRWCDALESAGVGIVRVEAATSELVQQTYDARGAVLLDAETSMGARLLRGTHAALVPLLVAASDEVGLPDGVFRLRPDLSEPELAHYVAEVLQTRRNLRRHPRVPAALRVVIGDAVTETTNISLYGVRTGVLPLRTGWRGRVCIELADGAVVHLSGRLVHEGDDALALAVRPVADTDLVLWLHALLERLARSPLHSEIDPFGPLFAED